MNEELLELAIEEVDLVTGGGEIDPPESLMSGRYPQVDNDPPG